LLDNYLIYINLPYFNLQSHQLSNTFPLTDLFKIITDNSRSDIQLLIISKMSILFYSQLINIPSSMP